MVFIRQTRLIYIFQLICQIRGIERIVRGEECEYETYPFAVAVVSATICGGIIISPKWVVTAAHCVSFENIRNGRSFLRTGFVYDQQFVQERRCKKAICHEKYFENSESEALELRYDIALLLVNKPFDQNDYVRPARLPTPGFTSKCSRATAVGIGITKPLEPGQFSQNITDFTINRTLNCAELSIVDAETCKETWHDSVIDSSIVCTRVDQSGRDACYGDSGGGLYCDGTVIGIISAFHGCGVPNNSAVHTKIEAHLDFIEKYAKYGGTDEVDGGWVRGVVVAVALNILVY